MIRNGAVYAWGIDLEGQLGNGTSEAGAFPIPSPVTGLSANVTAVDAGDSTCLAIQNGAVYGWGNNTSGQTGNGTYGTDNVTMPTAVAALSSAVTAVSAGDNSSLAIKGGGVYAWGNNLYGQLGNGTASLTGPPVVTPTLIAGLSTDVTAIAAGDAFAIALKDGKVYAWGHGDFGQLGDGTTVDASLPQQVPGLNDIVAIANAGQTGYALASNGTLWSWGENEFGETGLGDFQNDHLSPAQVPAPPGYFYTSIAANDSFHALATVAPIPEPALITPMFLSLIVPRRRPRRKGVEISEATRQ